MTRTETDVLTQAPVEFTLGGASHTVAPLPLGKAVKFQQHAWKLLGSLKQLGQFRLFTKSKGGGLSIEEGDIEAMQSVLSEIIGEHAEDVETLLYEYCQFSDDQISIVQENGTLPEFVFAVWKVAPLAFPLFPMLSQMGIKPDLDEKPENGTAKAPKPARASV